MLFWIFIVLLIVGIVLWVVGNEYYSDGMLFTGIGLTICGAIAVICSVGIMVENGIEADAKMGSWKARYESLVYQYENELYENDNDVGKRELMVDIEWWNSDLAYRKEIQRDFWVGIYVPNVYDEFEFIPLK